MVILTAFDGCEAIDQQISVKADWWCHYNYKVELNSKVSCEHFGCHVTNIHCVSKNAPANFGKL